MQKSTTTHRFKERHVGLLSFSHITLVHCPTCQSQAKVDTCRGVLSCSSCGYYQTEAKTYYCLEVQCNCSQCGKRIELSIDKVAQKKKNIKFSCKNCGSFHDYKPKHTDLSISKNIPNLSYNVKGIECIFGTDLWLKKTYKNHVFWANNYDHLDYLKQYIQAKVRERNNIQLMSMIARLPPFIKAKKNREDLLKIIIGLEKK